MRLISIILLFTFFGLTCKAQFDSSSYYKDTWNKQHIFDSLIRKELKGNLSESYFVITYPVLAGTTSYASQFIKAYDKIKNTKHDIVVLYYMDGGLRKRDIPLFMHDLFKLSNDDIRKIKIICNDKLYETITEKRNLLRLQYYYRRHLFYNEATKWHKLNLDILPQEKIVIQQTKKIKLSGIDSLLIFEKDAVYPYKKNHLLILSDATNAISDINTETGIVTPILNLLKIYHASDLYCKYFAKNDTAKCNFAKSNEIIYTSVNRKVFRILSVNYHEGKLIMPTGIEVVERDDNDFSFTNDEGNKKVIKAGSAALRPYSFIIHYDLASKDIQFYPINEQDTSEINTYILPEYGFFFSGDTIITSMHKWYPDRKTTYGLTKLVPNNYAYYLSNTLIPKEKPSGLLHAGYGTKSFFYKFNDQWYFTKNFSEEINLIGRNPVQEKFYGDGHKPYSIQKYAEYLEDTVEWEINFLFHEIKPVLNNRFLLSYGTFKDEPTFEIKNRMLKTVDIIDAKSIKGLEKYFTCKFREDILIDDDKVYYKSIENDEMYLNIFSISPLEK